MNLETAAACWAGIVNDWYRLDATTEEVIDAFNAMYSGDDEYIETFLKSKEGGFSKHLDTVDREGIADYIESARMRAVNASAPERGPVDHPQSLPGIPKMPISSVLRSVASQENCDGEPYDLMMAAANYIEYLEAQLKEA